MANAIEFNHVSKLYRLGLVSTGALKDDLHRFWVTKVLGKEDPYLKIGATNDRTTKGESDYVWALKDIDFKVEQGDVVGIIGKNGAGKSTLLKILSRVTGPTTGTIKARGRIGSLLEVGTGFHPEMTGRENIFMNGAILGMTHKEIQSKLDAIVDFSGCERYIDTPVKRYSSGMMVRLGFAVAAHLEPEILVVDEVLAVGDAEFQKKAIGKMQDVSKGDGRTVLFVSHNMASIKALCNHGILLENGCVKYTGNIDDVVDCYLKDNSYEAKELLSCLKYYTTLFHINTFTINGDTINSVKIDNNNHSIDIQVEGEAYSDLRLELEAQLFDSNRVLLASYCPCHTIGRSKAYKSGVFNVSERFELPMNITQGTFYMDIQFTEPNIDYLCVTQIPIKIETEGVVGELGRSLTYKERGFIVL